MNLLKLLALLFAPVLCLGAGHHVTLAWDAMPVAAGYRLYYGAETRSYTNMIECGTATQVTVSNLLAGTTYYFAVTDYDFLNLESDYSAEVSVRFKPAPPTITQGQVMLETPIVYWGSTNFSDWFRVTNASAWAVLPATNAVMFFRAVPQPTTIQKAP